jgi:hypothetical protein
MLTQTNAPLDRRVVPTADTAAVAREDMLGAIPPAKADQNDDEHHEENSVRYCTQDLDRLQSLSGMILNSNGRSTVAKPINVSCHPW